MWCFPYLTWLAIAGMVSIVVAMAFIPEQRTPLILGVASLGVLLVAYFVRHLVNGGKAGQDPVKTQFKPVKLKKS